VDASEQRLTQLAQGYQLSQARYVAAKLGVADRLSAGPLAAETIAEAVDARGPDLRRVLRALVAGGVFTELDDGRFALNDPAAALRADAPGRVRDVVVNFGEEMYRAFGELLHTVRTGETAVDVVYGKPLFDYYADDAEAESSGSARMLARTLPVARELANSGVLRGVRTLVDVGGGTGTVVAEVLKRNRAMRAVLLERGGVLELARSYLAEQGVADRCELVEGDFFASVPAGGDAYLLKSVLHDWPDERCVTILRNCATVMNSDARLLIVDAVLAERMTSSPNELPGALLDT
jgi:O-methyltransferase domain/Dimerisation domain